MTGIEIYFKKLITLNNSIIYVMITSYKQAIATFLALTENNWDNVN